MKSKKIIASITAMSVIAMSSMSFAAVTIRNSNISTLKTDKAGGTTIKFEGSTTIDEIVAEKGLTIAADSNANLSSTKVKAKAAINLSGIKVS